MKLAYATDLRGDAAAYAALADLAVRERRGLQRVQQGDEDARAARADRVAEGDRPPVDVGLRTRVAIC